MTSKWDVDTAIQNSNMAPNARLVMFVLISAADVETAEIPERFTPSLPDLARRSGLSRSTVAEWLTVLENTGWVKRARPSVADALNAGRRTCYQLCIGDQESSPKPTRERKRTVVAETPETETIVRQADGPPGGLSTQDSPPGGPSIVRQADVDSPPGGHKSSSSYQAHLHPSGGDADATQPEDGALFAAPPPPPPKPETSGQHANRLTKVYYDRVPMSTFIAVSKIVAKAITVGYGDEQITAGLNALADDPGRAVTLTSLRIAIEGGPKQNRAPDWRDVSNQDHSAWTKGTR